MSQVIIMLSGYMKSGKDTVGDYLCTSYGFKRYAFADILKDEVAEMYNIDRDLLDTQEGKASYVWNTGGKPFTSSWAVFILNLFGRVRTVRNILITHGQARRAENINYWVDKVKERITKDNYKRVVITDWRFPNEYTQLAECSMFPKVLSWRIDRWEEPPLKDPSETALDDFVPDANIDNTSSFLDLFLHVDDELLIVNPANLSLLLVDVDDTLLDWITNFKAFVDSLGTYRTNGDYPTRWDMEGWITVDGENVQKAKAMELVKMFNSSLFFGKLKPRDGAVEALQCVQDKGYIVVAITACSTDHIVESRRKENLESVFGKNVNKVICLELGENKEDILSYFRPSIWIDDSIVNVDAGEKCGHTSFLMATPWNAEFADRVKMLSSWKDLKV